MWRVSQEPAHQILDELTSDAASADDQHAHLREVGAGELLGEGDASGGHTAERELVVASADRDRTRVRARARGSV